MRLAPTAPGGELPGFGTEFTGGDDPDLNRPGTLLELNGGDASRLVRDEPDGDESGNGVIVGSTLPKNEEPVPVPTRGCAAEPYFAEDVEFIGAAFLSSGEGGGDPFVEERPPTTEGVKWTFFVVASLAAVP